MDVAPQRSHKLFIKWNEWENANSWNLSSTQRLIVWSKCFAAVAENQIFSEQVFLCRLDLHQFCIQWPIFSNIPKYCQIYQWQIFSNVISDILADSSGKIFAKFGLFATSLIFRVIFWQFHLCVFFHIFHRSSTHACRGDDGFAALSD